MKAICILITFLLLFLVSHADKQHELDSLEKLLPTQPVSHQLKIYSDLCWEYGTLDVDKAMQFAKKAKLLALSTGDSLATALSYNDLGILYYRTSKYDSALYYYFRALPLRRTYGDSASVASVLSKIGVAFQEQGQFAKATVYQLEAYRIYSSLSDSVRLSQCMNNLARVYYENGDYASSIHYNREALEIFYHFNHRVGIATTLGSIALSYEMMNHLDTAIIMLTKSLDLFREIGDKSNQATALVGLGKLYRRIGEIDKGIHCYSEAINLGTQTGELHSTTIARANLAGFYIDKGNYQKARELLHQALQTALELNILPLIHQCYREYSTLYEKMGNFKEALKYKTLQFAIHDSVYNKEKFAEIAKLQTQFETVQKEQKIKLLNTRDQLNKLKIRRQQFSIFIIGLAFLILAFISFLLIKSRKLKQKAALEKAGNQHRKELLNSTLQAEENERQRIARELHDGIAQQLSGIKMAWQSLGNEIEQKDKSSAKKIIELTKTLDESADEVRNLSHQMMPRTLKENGLVSALEDMLEKSLKYSAIKYNFEHFALETRLEDKLELSLYRIAQELINNIIKHAGASEVNIQLIKSSKYMVLIVEDDGKGFSRSEGNSKGIGMMNIASRIDTINGEINIEPSPGSGTVATVRVPLND